MSQPLKARVRNGRLVLDEPTDLPEGIDVDLVFADGPIHDYRGMLKGDAAKLKRFNALCMEEGIIKGDNKIYISLAHTDAVIEEALAGFERALKRLN